jgi:hypothetical protein
MKTVVTVKKIVTRLVNAHEDKEEVLRQTKLIEHGGGWGARLPDDKEEVREVARRRALKQGLRGARDGASTTADVAAAMPAKGTDGAHELWENGSPGNQEEVKTEAQPHTPVDNICKEQCARTRARTPLMQGMFKRTPRKWETARTTAAMGGDEVLDTNEGLSDNALRGSTSHASDDGATRTSVVAPEDTQPLV